MYGWIAVNYLKGALCHALHKAVLEDVLQIVTACPSMCLPALCSVHCGFRRAHEGHHRVSLLNCMRRLPGAVCAACPGHCAGQARGQSRRGGF